MMQSMYSHSYLFGGNAPFIEELYEQYLVDANSVPQEWRDYFDKLAQAPAPPPPTGKPCGSRWAC
ncbi:2-oxoglutarate dehydrogenase E1 component [Chromobacterium violaceum]|uniref:2-oxoglutarate dehydrogenase E1 component n=1 Tax=Chromobacterium violaceum TaxID=536 RepID=A0A447T854_CHRVL|nr:2-oxoglutarate dehydrogenase E1 component [Chromobacterium violaceum]